MRWETCILTKQAKRGASGHENVQKYSASQGHTTTGPQHDFSQTMAFKRWSRTILKDVVGERLTHDCPCSRQTGKRFRNSYTSQKNGPQTNQPTNKQTSFDLQISFTKWPSIRATATDLKIPQKMAWWPQTRLKILSWRFMTKNFKRSQKVGLLISMVPQKAICGSTPDAS